MPRSEALKRAQTKYVREKTKQVCVRFSAREMEVYDHIASQEEGMATYLKRLVREDMARH